LLNQCPSVICSTHCMQSFFTLANNELTLWRLLTCCRRNIH
jgi:hypothetical protein